MAKVKIRALRPFFGVYGKVRPGDVVEVAENHAKLYERKGLAIPELATKKAPELRNKEEVTADPLDDKSPVGGRKGGKAQPWLSSPEGQASEKSGSKKSADK